MLIECNVRWPEDLIAAISTWSTVVTVAPTGFCSGGRAPSADSYTLQNFEAELLEAVELTGKERFSILGYSMSAAFGAWLAMRCDRVDTVVAGGFPIFGDYQLAVDHVRDRLDREDEEGLGADPAAARVFWEHIAGLEPGALARPLSARLAVFFGSDDSLVDRVGNLKDLEKQARANGFPVMIMEGASHGDGVARMIELEDWFHGCLAQRR